MSIEDPRCIHCGSQKGIEDGVCKNCGTPQKTKEELIADDPSVGSEVDRFYSKLLNNIAHEGIDPYQCNQCGKKHKDAMEVYIHNTKTGHTARETIDEPIYLPTGPTAPNYVSDYLPNSVEDNVFTPLDTDEDDQYITNINKLIFNDNDALEPVNPPGQVKKYTEEATGYGNCPEGGQCDANNAYDESENEGGTRHCSKCGRMTRQGGEPVVNEAEWEKEIRDPALQKWWNGLSEDEKEDKLNQIGGYYVNALKTNSWTQLPPIAQDKLATFWIGGGESFTKEADDTFDSNWKCPRCNSSNIKISKDDDHPTRECLDCGLGKSSEAETKYELDDKGDYVPEDKDKKPAYTDDEMDWNEKRFNKTKKDGEAIGDWSTGNLDNEIEKWWDINKEKYPQWGGKHQPYWDELGDIEERPTVRQLYKTLVLGTEAENEDFFGNCEECGAQIHNYNHMQEHSNKTGHQMFKNIKEQSSEAVDWQNLGGKKVIDMGSHFETDKGELITWDSVNAERAQHVLQYLSKQDSLESLFNLGKKKVNAREFKVGDKVKMTDDALDNYGKKYKNKVFTISHVAHSTDEHPGYDEGLNAEDSEEKEGLYDLEGFNSSLYDYELQRAGESYAQEKTLEEHDKIDKVYSWMLRQVEYNTVDGYYSDLPKEAADQFGITEQEADNIWNSAGISNEGIYGGLSMKTYHLIKDGKQIKMIYGSYGMAKDEADKIGADQIYDGGDFYMTDYGKGKSGGTSYMWGDSKMGGEADDTTSDNPQDLMDNNKTVGKDFGAFEAQSESEWYNSKPSSQKRQFILGYGHNYFGSSGEFDTSPFESLPTFVQDDIKEWYNETMATEAGTDPEGYYKPDPDETFQCLQCKKDFGNDFKGFFQHSRTAHLNGESYATEKWTMWKDRSEQERMELLQDVINNNEQHKLTELGNELNLDVILGTLDTSSAQRLVDRLKAGGLLGEESLGSEADYDTPHESRCPYCDTLFGDDKTLTKHLRDYQGHKDENGNQTHPKMHESLAQEGITYFHNGKTYNVEIEPTYVSVDEMYQDNANQWHNGKNIYFAQGEDISNLEEDAGGLYVNKILDYLDSGGILGKESVSQEKTPYPWEDCINDNKDKGMDSAKRICGSIKAKYGGEADISCGKCNGSGTLYNGIKCGMCNGTGLVDENNDWAQNNVDMHGNIVNRLKQPSSIPSQESVSIDDFRRIKDNFQAEDIKFQDGIDTVDAQTANAVVAVYNGISEQNKEKFNKLIQTTDGVVKIASIMFGGEQ